MGETEQEDQIRIVLFDDHRLFRCSLARFLASETGLEVAGECGSSVEALAILQTSAPHLILLDFHPGSDRGSAFLTAARHAGYQGHFLIVTDQVDAAAAAVALKLGASGIFLKSEAPDRLVHAIRTVASGDLWIEPKVIQMLADQLINQSSQPEDAIPASGLQERERCVLLGILGGLTNRKIGENMGISESSVKNIVQRLFGKAGVKRRSQLVRVALEGSLGATEQLISRHSWSETPHHTKAVPDPIPVGQSQR